MDDPERVEGVDFTGINPVLNDISYPITTAEFVEQYGGRANYSDRGGATPTETEAANAVAEQPDPDTSTEK